MKRFYIFLIQESGPFGGLDDLFAAASTREAADREVETIKNIRKNSPLRAIAALGGEMTAESINEIHILDIILQESSRIEL